MTIHHLLSSIAFATVLMSALPASLAAEDWENPDMFGKNRQPPHATLLPYHNGTSALAGIARRHRGRARSTATGSSTG